MRAAVPARSWREHDRIILWLTAIAHTGLAGPVDDSRLPGEMLVEHAAVYQRDLYVDDGDPEYSESGAWQAGDARRLC